MSENLLLNPRCGADDLGLPMPDEVHAVSACLPLWEHNIGYEEGAPEVVDQLQAAYPRFQFHPLIRELCDRYLNDDHHQGLPFATRCAAQRAVNYVNHAAAVTATIVPFENQTAAGVTVPRQHFDVLKQYWQHAGENVSSRMADQILHGHPATYSETAARTKVRDRVSRIHGVSSDHTFLFASGMAAIAQAWRAGQTLGKGTSCQFGFPYVDTLKIQQRFPGASHSFYPLGNTADLQQLETLCQSAPPGMVFCEVPTNPLLTMPDIVSLRKLADDYGFVLVIDDTLSACGNLNVLPLADIVVTSLTKYFSGQGNVLAGSLVINPQSHHAEKLHQAIQGDFEETLSDIDVDVLGQNSDDIAARMSQVNSNAAALADFLRQHPAVESVYYPSADDPNYKAVRTPNGGYGGLLSIVLKEAAQVTPSVFDRLAVCKGPNLGTVFTLCCPYTILAHYTELDFAEECGVSRWLLRISVGIEPCDELISRFAAALEVCQVCE